MLRHVSTRYALRQAFDNGGLSHARLAHENRIVLGAPRQDLHHPADFFVSPYDRVELSILCQLREIDAEPLQHPVLRFRFRIGDAMGAAHFFQRLIDLLAVDAGFPQNLVSIAVLGPGNRDQEMLGANIFIL